MMRIRLSVVLAGLISASPCLAQQGVLAQKELQRLILASDATERTMLSLHPNTPARAKGRDLLRAQRDSIAAQRLKVAPWVPPVGWLWERTVYHHGQLQFLPKGEGRQRDVLVARIKELGDSVALLNRQLCLTQKREGC